MITVRNLNQLQKRLRTNRQTVYPVYSNPWYMRVMSATYVGHLTNDANMTHWGNVWASEAITEFDRHGTLSEVRFTWKTLVVYFNAELLLLV